MKTHLSVFFSAAKGKKKLYYAMNQRLLLVPKPGCQVVAGELTTESA